MLDWISEVGKEAKERIRSGLEELRGKLPAELLVERKKEEKPEEEKSFPQIGRVEPEVIYTTQSPFFFRDGFMPTRTTFEVNAEGTLPVGYEPYFKARVSAKVLRSVSFMGQVDYPLLVDKSRTRLSVATNFQSMWTKLRIRADGDTKLRIDGPVTIQGRRISLQGYISNDSALERIRVAAGLKHSYKDWRFISSVGLCARDGPFIDNITQYKKPRDPLRFVFEPCFSLYLLRFTRSRLICGWFDPKSEAYLYQDLDVEKQRNNIGACCVYRGSIGFAWISYLLKDRQHEVQTGAIVTMSPVSQILLAVTTNGQVTIQTRLNVTPVIALNASFSDRVFNPSNNVSRFSQKVGLSVTITPDNSQYAHLRKFSMFH